jgi:Flp pilus assembly protein TadG
MTRLLRSQRGTALIETALILPILLLICVGIFEFGRAYQTWEVLTNAAREGARVVILPSAGPSEAEARVRDYLKAGGLAYGASVGVSVTPASVSMGDAGSASGWKVTVTYPFSFMVLQPVAQLVVSGTMTGSPISIVATATMREEI